MVSNGRLTNPAAPENADQARASLSAGNHALVWRRLVCDTETPVGAALKLIEPGRGDFLLESVEGGEVRGRYSLLGIDPDLMFRATGAASGSMTAMPSRPCPATVWKNCATWPKAAGWTCPRHCRPRSPVWSATSVMRPSVW
jgi:Anthranilate synthase component I, N terminal region